MIELTNCPQILFARRLRRWTQIQRNKSGSGVPPVGRNPQSPRDQHTPARRRCHYHSNNFYAGTPNTKMTRFARTMRMINANMNQIDLERSCKPLSVKCAESVNLIGSFPDSSIIVCNASDRRWLNAPTISANPANMHKRLLPVKISNNRSPRLRNCPMLVFTNISYFQFALSLQ